ncbi:MAG: hypothetical protein ABIN01_04120 [Ferruginibacter sp.]
MKKVLMIVVSGVIYASAVTSPVAAQTATNSSYAAQVNVDKNEFLEFTKPKENTVADPLNKTAVKDMKANLKEAKAKLKATSNFSNRYQDVSDVKWYAEEKAIVSSFKMQGKSGRSVYNKKGSWIFTIITYYKDQLPQQEKSLVEDSYPDFEITLVQEIHQGTEKVYVVHLESITRLKQILISDNEITPYRDFTKQK